ncbi:MAG TPA: tryptophan halogenase family protein [Steroidobacteraceae bacterium]|nr:tryptophan halogenase family protein [Steroidobacteraceae bacterium]
MSDAEPFRIIVVGGGTAGWLTVAYLARMLSADLYDGAKISIIEAPDIDPIGVGEGTFPSIRKTLSLIGIEEELLFREADATFKQGIRFVDWTREGHKYYHLFHPADRPGGLDLLPYWLLGEAGDQPWSAVCNVQSRVVDAALGPKPVGAAPSGELAYAFHFDAIAMAGVLRRFAEPFVTRIEDKVRTVHLTADGSVESLETERSGMLRGDLFIDCTGFRAEIIGKAMGIPWTSCRDQLFVDRAVTIGVPHSSPMSQLPSCTIATAKDAGWIWDIALRRRRGVGYVYSSGHCSDTAALAVLENYVGGWTGEPRLIRFDTGYRKVQWHKNCVAVGLSAGFLEPLEATGIGLVESAIRHLVAAFPWDRQFDAVARVFNEQMNRRFRNIIDFIKLHYCTSGRRDSSFWIENTDSRTASASLMEKLSQWRYRPPGFIDIDYSCDTFIEENWRQVLYGMEFRTDLSARRSAFRFFEEARRSFSRVQTQGAMAAQMLPPHRHLVESICVGARAARVAKTEVPEG